MSALTPLQLKRALVEAGFEVFRTRGDEIVLAERVRENLIMDSGVRVRASDPHEVRIVLRAQRTDYPGDDEVLLFSRVRELASRAVHAGFVELSTAVAPVRDPADDTRTLDTFYEIVFTKIATSLDNAFEVTRFALGLEKIASPRKKSVPP
ncbi:MAG: hypothetical protein U0169_27445 [Polyangiaceae bacterium]